MTNDEPKAKVILYLQDVEDRAFDARKRGIEIEDPSVIPIPGDHVSFANRHGWIVVERNIVYHGSAGPDRQALVTVLLRHPFSK